MSERPVYHYPEDVESRNGTHMLRDGTPVEVIPSAKMSKSKKNVVDPDAIVKSFGADTVRWFVLSDSPPERDVEWTASGAEAAHRYLARVHRMAREIVAMPAKPGDGDGALTRATHQAIETITRQIDGFAFNAAIAGLYAFTSIIAKSDAGGPTKQQAVRALAQMMAPFTPHLSEEIWQMTGGDGFVSEAPWPVADPHLNAETHSTIPVQVNGKRRGEVTAAIDEDRDVIAARARDLESVRRWIADKPIRKVIVVPGKIVNFVI